jgi:predicted Zn finger-like uncharacterized protein
MPTVVACPSCAGKLRVPDELRGQKVRCPACKTVFAAAAPLEPPPPAPNLPLRLSLDEPDAPAAPPPAVPKGSGFGFVELDLSLDGPREPAPAPPPLADTPGSPPTRRTPHLNDEHDDLRECPTCGRHAHRDSTRCSHCGQRLAGRPRIVQDYPERRDWEPERGGLVLVLGVLSLMCLAVCGPIGVALGITAWVLGHADLRKMKARQMDPAGYSTTQGGYVCGIIGTALNALWTLGCAGFFTFVWYDTHRPIPTRPARPPVQWKDQGKW